MVVPMYLTSLVHTYVSSASYTATQPTKHTPHTQPHSHVQLLLLLHVCLHDSVDFGGFVECSRTCPELLIAGVV